MARIVLCGNDLQKVTRLPGYRQRTAPEAWLANRPPTAPFRMFARRAETVPEHRTTLDAHHTGNL